MTGREILERALTLLGYTAGGSDRLGDLVLRGGREYLNTVYVDLWQILRRDPFLPLRDLDEQVALNVRGLECMPAGVAMLIAGARGDASAQQLFAGLYNAKRMRLGRVERRRDLLPVPADA